MRSRSTFRTVFEYEESTNIAAFRGSTISSYCGRKIESSLLVGYRGYNKIVKEWSQGVRGYKKSDDRQHSLD